VRLGPVLLDGPFVLAPMAGVSDPPFRRLCRRNGASLVCAEMVSANALHFKDKRSQRMLEVFPDEHPLSLQVFGSDPDRLAKAAKMAAAAGADIVDLNCGCPVPKVMRTGAGLALTKDEKNLARCLEKMVSAVNVPVTAKFRLGARRGRNDAVRLARLAESCGVAAVTVHARWKDAGHSGPPDLEALHDVAAEVRIPVLGNGGVQTAADARRMIETGCVGVMVGQAAMGNPLIFRELWEGEKAKPFSERGVFDLLLEHARMNVAYFGEKLGIVRLRKVMGAYIKNFPQAATFRHRAYQVETLSELVELLNQVRP